MFIIEQFWCDDSDIKVFSSKEEASEYMKKAFHSYLEDFGYEERDGKILDNKGEDVSDICYCYDYAAKFDGIDMLEENKTNFKLWEITGNIAKF